MAFSSHAELPAPVRHDLARAAAALATAGAALPVIFATDNFAPLVGNWLRHAKAAGVTASLIIAMDQGLSDRLARAGIASVRHGFDGTFGGLWYQRTLVFEWLAAAGIDFIHSDVDAVWLRDPRPLCFADASFDLVFSQGTNFPAETWRDWGFVLCCGLFAARGRPATAAFFAAVRAEAAAVRDDQVAVNVLLQRSGLAWSSAGENFYRLATAQGHEFTCHRQVLSGFSEGFGLNVGLLPHHRVPRLPILGTDALVRHPVGPPDPVAKAALLRSVGCWMD